MSSIDAISTTAKNVVTAINSSSVSLAKNFANNALLGVSLTTLIESGASRLINFSVVVAGSDAGFIYDANSVNVVNGFNILSATTSGTAITVTFQSGYIFPVGSSITLTGTGAGLDGTYPVITSSAGTVTATCSLIGATTTGKIRTGQVIASIPTVQGVIDINWPVTLGIVVAPGAGQIVSVGWQ